MVGAVHRLHSAVSIEEPSEVEGRVSAVLAGTRVRMALPNEHIGLANLSGRMRQRFVRLTIGDRVRMEMSQ